MVHFITQALTGSDATDTINHKTSVFAPYIAHIPYIIIISVTLQ